MLASFRKALALCAALTATIIAPAQAGPSSETMVSVANATLPKIAIPQLIDPNGKPTLAQPQGEEPNPLAQPDGDDDSADATPAIKAGGDLPAMVAALRGAEAGGRELECLA